MTLVRASLLILSIVGAAYCAWRIPRPRGAFYQWVWALTLVALCVEIFGVVSSELHIRNTYVYNAYAIVEFVVLLRLVRTLRPAWWRWLVMIATMGVIAMAAFVWMHGLDLAIEGILILCVLVSAVFIWLLIDMARNERINLARSPVFWLFTGALFYFGGIIPILGAWSLLGRLDKDAFRTMYWIVTGLAVVRYLAMAWACILERERRMA